jgi:hypothetical protein
MIISWQQGAPAAASPLIDWGFAPQGAGTTPTPTPTPTVPTPTTPTTPTPAGSGTGGGGQTPGGVVPALLGGEDIGHDFEGELNMRLRSDVDLQAVVGGRVYPMALPQKAALPALVFAVAGKRRDRTLNGPAGMTYATVHLDVRAARYTDVKAGAEALRNLLDGFRGTLARSVSVVVARLDDQADDYEWPEDSSARGTQHETLTFVIKYREPLPVGPA